MTAIPLNRHEAARIAAAAIHSYASRADGPLSYDAMGAAAVDALVHLGALQVVDLDHVSAGRRAREEHHALDRDQDEVDREREFRSTWDEHHYTDGSRSECEKDCPACTEIRQIAADGAA